MTTSPMVQMSRAIRRVIEDNTPMYGKDLRGLPDLALVEFTQIVGAFALDLRAELDRRNLEASDEA